MIGHWPDPLPGELLYSVAARFQVRVGYPNLKGVVAELFGHGCALATVDLPRGLDHLVASLPPGHRYTVDGLIDGHTALPFYAPFLPPARRAQVRADMRGPHGAAALLRVGIIAGGVPSPEFLRTCPHCDAQDQERHGETYWHRLHQLTGIEVCPVHQIFLENTDARRRHERTRHGFVAAQESRRVSEARPIKPEDPHHQCLLRLARTAAWLFERADDGSPSCPLPTSPAHYGVALAARDLAGVNGQSVRWPGVRAILSAHFPAAFLHACGSELRGDCDWLAKLLRSDTKVQAPLRHLLFMDAFGLDVRDGQGSTRHPGPFGRGPWPCHGPTCPQRGQSVIARFRVERGGKHGIAVGIFTCEECAFTYGRAVRETERREEPFDFVRDYGRHWRQTLVRLWADEDTSLRAIARTLDADPLTIKRYAVDLGLAFPRAATRPSHRPLAIHRHPADDMRKRRKNTIPADRGAWLRALANMPSAGVTEVSSAHPALYTRLYRADRHWLRQHPGAVSAPASRPVRVDWLLRDRRLASLIGEAASRLRLAVTGKPRLVSRAALARAVKAVALIQHHPDRLPLTLAALNGGAESRVDYALRRVDWAVQSLFEELRWLAPPQSPQRWELVRRAGLRSELLPVELRIETALAAAHAGLLARLVERGTSLDDNVWAA